MPYLLSLVFLLSAPWPEADLYLDGRHAESAGKYGDAVAAYAKCAATDNPFTPYARLRSAYCRGMGGDFDGSMKEYEGVLAQAPSGPWVRMAAVERAGLLARKGKHDEASKLYASALSVTPKRWWLEQYEWQAAENNLTNPDTLEQAFNFYRGVVATARRRDPRVQAALKLSVSPTPDDRLTAVASFLRAGANKEATVCMAAVPMESVEAGEQTARWRYLMGRIQLQANQAQKGRELLQQALDGTPDTKWGRLALSHLARSYVTTDETEAASTAFARLKKDYPDSEETGDALWWYAERLAGSKSPKSAIAQYMALAAVCPSHERADDGLLAAGHLARNLGSKAEALRLYADFAKRFPASWLLPEALFWSGRMHEAAGDTKGAREEYAKAAKSGLGNYYTHRALDRAAGLGDKQAAASANLRVDGKKSFLRPLPAPSEAPKSLPASMTEAPQVKRLLYFAEHGLEEAEWEALELAQSPPPGDGMPAALYQLLAEAGLPFSGGEIADAANWGQELGKPTLARQRLTYARAYWSSLAQIGNDAGVDPFLIESVARQESTFRPDLTSPAGARGVMQIMPGTAKGLIKGDPDLPAGAAERLGDPSISLRLGAKYLGQMISRFDGNLVYAVASYNAGPGNVAKWRKSGPGLDLETFVETIPFTETRDYVKRVLGNYAAYHSLYPAEK